jgi:hypothetical protein
MACIFDIGVIQDIAPECSNLVRIVDFHDIELLYEFSVDLQLLSLKLRDYSFSQVDGY